MCPHIDGGLHSQYSNSGSSLPCLQTHTILSCSREMLYISAIGYSVTCFRFLDALSLCTDYTAGAETEVYLLPRECSPYKIVHHVLTLWFALHPLLSEYSTTSLWYVIDWWGRDCAVTFPLFLMKSYHNDWVWMVHTHTIQSLFKGKKVVKNNNSLPSLSSS